MRLDNSELYNLLQSKNILSFYHANTVSTSITYLEQRGLLSREFIERNGLYQTPQDSDKKDKELGVFNDIFLDSTDLHTYFSRQNLYGPVSFKISIEFLKTEDYEIWVTKNNPIYWTTTMSDFAKYFVSVKELKDLWDSYQRQRKMITIKNSNNPILFDYVEEIIVDDPQTRVGEKVYFNEAVKSLSAARVYEPRLKNKFRTRTCTGSCFCKSNYRYQHNEAKLNKLFLPAT